MGERPTSSTRRNGDSRASHLAALKPAPSAPFEPRFSIRMYDGHGNHEQLPASEVRGIDAGGIDFHWDRVFGLIQIMPRDERIIAYRLTLPGVGAVGETLLAALMDRPGELMTPWDIVQATGYRWFYNKNNLASRLAALRRAFGEDSNHPHFFLTRRHPYAVCWNADRSWRVIDKIRSEGTGQ